MINATDLRKGMCIKLNGELYRVFSTHHLTPGNIRGMVQAKLRSFRTGALIDHRFRSTDRIEKISLQDVEMEYLYRDGTAYYFMNTETYEQILLEKDILGESVYYLVSNTKIAVKYYESQPVGIEMPPSVSLKVVETEPGLKGATVSNVNKPAKLETGLVVQVPPFIDVGEVIRVDTSDGKYIERAKQI